MYLLNGKQMFSSKSIISGVCPKSLEPNNLDDGFKFVQVMFAEF